MKLAIIHDWIVDIGGAERVFIELHRMWPEAPIYTLLHRPATTRGWLPHATIISSELQRLPFAHRFYSMLAPLMPSAIESFDLSMFDTVISSSVLFSKGVVVRPDTKHICYCYSPSRMLWDRAASYERKGMISGSISTRPTRMGWRCRSTSRYDGLHIANSCGSRPEVLSSPLTRHSAALTRHTTRNATARRSR